MTTISKTDVLRHARGRWPEILTSLCPELADALQTRRHVRCPLPHHDDQNPSFRIDDPENGKAICTCGSYGPFKLIMSLRHVSFPETLDLAAGYLGVSANGNGKVDLLAKVCAAKRMPIESATAYGAHLAKRGKADVVRFPVANEQGELHSYFDIPSDGKGDDKGWFRKGKGSGGLFLPIVDDKPRLPADGETWILCEGPKDAAAYHSLAYFACGLPGDQLAAKYSRLFRGCNIVLMPDRTTDAEDKAKRSAARLHGVAASVRIGTLPLEIGGDRGDDARDVLRLAGGESLLRQAVGDAVVWAPKAKTEATCIVANVIEIVDGKKKQSAPLLMSEIMSTTKLQTDDWPRRVDGALFVDDEKHGIGWLEKPAALFGFYQSRVGSVKWQNGDEYVGKAEFFAELQRTAQSYRSVETLPHQPMISEHYYTCGPVQPGDGKALRELLDRFSPATDIDRDLLQSAYMTPAWGGPSGLRPAFVITSDDGRGAGKTTIAKMVGRLWGGLLDFSHREDINRIKTRLLSGDALPKRVCLLDNVKSLRFSWGELEAMVTSPVIGGHKLFVGESTRPNNLTWFITLNGASLSTDMAQRSVIIKVKRPNRSATWEEDTARFIDTNQDRLIADCIGALQAEPSPLSRYTRWATWEKDILQRLPEPGETQSVIMERQSVADAEKDDAELLEEYFADQLDGLHYDVDADQVFIPSGVAREWFNHCHNDKQKTGGVSRMINQLIDEGTLKNLQKCGRKWGRGFVWYGNDAVPDDPIRTDIASRIQRRD